MRMWGVRPHHARAQSSRPWGRCRKGASGWSEAPPGEEVVLSGAGERAGPDWRRATKSFGPGQKKIRLAEGEVGSWVGEHGGGA